MNDHEFLPVLPRNVNQICDYFCQHKKLRINLEVCIIGFFHGLSRMQMLSQEIVTEKPSWKSYVALYRMFRCIVIVPLLSQEQFQWSAGR